MRVFLFILCVLSFVVGGLIFVAAKSAIHEIEASLLFLISAVFLVGAAIVEAIDRLLKIEHEAMNAQRENAKELQLVNGSHREIVKALQWMVDNWRKD